MLIPPSSVCCCASQYLFARSAGYREMNTRMPKTTEIWADIESQADEEVIQAITLPTERTILLRTDIGKYLNQFEFWDRESMNWS